MSLKDWSITESGNNLTLGIQIGENVTPFANMNNALREAMAQIRQEVAHIGSNVSASGTPDIGSVGGALTMLGVTTVTGFATAPAGLVRTIHFETATPIVPGSNLSAPFTSIVMQKGDVQVQRSLGSGAWKVEYNSRLLPLGKHKLSISAAALRPDTSSPAAAADVKLGNVQMYVLDFDQSSIEGAWFQISMPSSSDETVAMTFIPVWTAASGSGDVVWTMFSWARGNDDPITDAGFPTGASSIDTLTATGDLCRGPESGSMTPDDTWAANDTIFFTIVRNGASGSDTLNADARLLGIELYITTNEAVDVA